MDPNSEGETNKIIELKHINQVKKIRHSSTTLLPDLVNTFALLNKEMKTADYFYQFIALSLTIDEDKEYDMDPVYIHKVKEPLPWDLNFYNDKSDFKLYTQRNIPEWLSVKNLSMNIYK